MALTRRQREIYDFICSFVDEHGYSPSLEEIGGNFGLSSVATVHKHVQHLVEKGMLRKAWNRSRSVEPVEAQPAASVVSLPLLGVVAAGAPIEAIEVPETIDVPRQLVPRRWQLSRRWTMRRLRDSHRGRPTRWNCRQRRPRARQWRCSCLRDRRDVVLRQSWRGLYPRLDAAGRDR